MNCGKNPKAFKRELERKVLNYAHKRPIIYFQHWTRDRFIDNTKDRWRSERDIVNKEDMLDEIANMTRLDYYINEKYDRLGYLDINLYFNIKNPNRIKNKMYKCLFNYVIDELNEKNRNKKNMARKYYYKREWAKKGYVFNDFDAFYNKYITIRNCERCDDYFGSFCNTRGRNSRRILPYLYRNLVVCRVCLEIWEADW
jgi:hypothetical protein